MAARQNRPNPPPPGAGQSRQNEYFVPRDGIDREVITADVCRYLGNDALVRPGTYEHADGRNVQGYYINAYRNLTSAMIQDLKADSARWDQERRAASRPSGNAVGASSRGTEAYRFSETHYQRQQYGPTAADPSYGDAMAIDPPYAAAPGPAPVAHRYPGTGNGGYNGVSSSGPGYPAQRGYEPASAFAAAPQYAAAQHAQYGPESSYAPAGQAGDMYNNAQAAASAPMVNAQYAQRSTAQDPGQYIHGAAYAVTGAPSRAAFQAPAPAYPGAPDYTSYPPAAGAAAPSAYTHPVDIFYGRAGNPQHPTSGYNPGPEPQYTNTQSPVPAAPRVPVPSSSKPQIPSSTTGTAGATRRDRDRDQDRHRDSRDRERERDRDRDVDRHAAERHSHRHRTRQ